MIHDMMSDDDVLIGGQVANIQRCLPSSGGAGIAGEKPLTSRILLR
jgi:hypothetical protein